MTDIWMDVGISLAEVPVNVLPLINDTDFKSIENAVAFNAAGMALLWHFVTTGGVMTETAVVPTSAGVHDWLDQGTSGLYAIEIPASTGTVNNDTEGFGWFTGVATGVLPWRGPVIGFRAAALNNALIDGGDVLDTNLTEFLGVPVTGTMLTSRDIGQLYESAITTVTGQQEHIMTVAIVSNNVWLGNIVTVQDVSTGETWATWISSVVQVTDTLFLGEAPPFTIVAGDIIRIESRKHPLFALNTYDSPTRNEATVDKTAILDSLGIAQNDLDLITGVDGVTLATLQGLYAPAKAGDAMALVANALNAAAIATNAITSTKIAAGAITSTKFAVGAINAAALATDAVTEIAQGTWAEVLGVTTMSASALLQIIAGVTAGKISGAATATVTIRNIEDLGNVIVATTDASGNRSAIVITIPVD